TGAMMAYPVGAAHGGSTLTFLLCLAGIAALIQARQRNLLVLCLVPVAVSLVAGFLHRDPFGGSARLAPQPAPPLCLLMACGIVQVLSWLRGARAGFAPQWTELCIVSGLSIIAVCGLTWNIYRPYKMPGDQQIRRLLQDVASKVQPNDVIVVFEQP